MKAPLLSLLCLIASIATATATAAPAPAAAPQRVLSLNLCTDQLLMALLPPQRIASITWLSRTEGDPALLDIARQLPVNHGSPEEVLAARPDLVLAGKPVWKRVTWWSLLTGSPSTAPRA